MNVRACSTENTPHADAHERCFSGHGGTPGERAAHKWHTRPRHEIEIVSPTEEKTDRGSVSIPMVVAHPKIIR